MRASAPRLILLAVVVVGFSSSTLFGAVGGEGDASQLLIGGGVAVTNLGAFTFVLRWFMNRLDADRKEQREITDAQLKESREMRRSLDQNTNAILILTIESKDTSDRGREQAKRIKAELEAKPAD